MLFFYLPESSRNETPDISNKVTNFSMYLNIYVCICTSGALKQTSFWQSVAKLVEEILWRADLSVLPPLYISVHL